MRLKYSKVIVFVYIFIYWIEGYDKNNKRKKNCVKVINKY